MQNWSVKVGAAAIGMLPALTTATGAHAIDVVAARDLATWAAQTKKTETSNGLSYGYQSAYTTNDNSWQSRGKIHHNASGRVSIIEAEIFSSVDPQDCFSEDQTPPIKTVVSKPRVEEQRWSDYQKQQLKDALSFLPLLSNIEWRPSIWTGDGEIVFEWIADGKHAVVSFEGDGLIGYTILHGDDFVAGSLLDPPASILPPDLLEYLTAA